MEELLRTYGYAAVLLWACIGAEESVLIAGILAAQGYLSLSGIIVASAVGGSLGDQVCFYAARHCGQSLPNRLVKLRRSYERAHQLVCHYGVAVALASRFLVGLRITVSAVCGALGLNPMTYSSLNLISAFVWASFYGMLSYEFGRAVVPWVAAVTSRLTWALILLAVLISLSCYFWKRGFRARLGSGDGEEQKEGPPPAS